MPTTSAAPTTSPADLNLDALVDATPDGRDRVVDALRALSIAVVVLWHWVLSITHVDASGALTMPNPIDRVPGLWLATWVLQIMPVFFVVGGYANLAGWEAVRRRGGGWTAYARRRLARLLRPVGAFVAVWLVLDVVVRLARPGTASVWTWGRVVFVPLWFLGAYVAVVLLAPLAVAAHRRRPWLAVGLLGGAVVALDLARFHLGWTAAGLVSSLLVWVFAHQLGLWWRDGTATAWSVARRGAVAAAGLAGLVVLTGSGWYPRSMVAVRGEDVSNLFPTTACVAALAVFQAGLVLLARPALDRLLARRAAWRATVAVNAVAMTVFTWHMTALVAVIGVWRVAGGTLRSEADAAWWAQRPLWLLGPGLVLAGLVAAFGRLERPRPTPAPSPGVVR
ncbi:MAG TPA: acyltransferase [Aquihabitans sp.]|nr:acyltransferase [Aquihabitans sp.]